MKRRVLSFMTALTLCVNLCPVWAFAADEGTDDGLCPHHPAHTDECGYIPESPDALCAFACQVCPVEDLIGKLPDSVSEDNSEQVQAQLSEIYALYDGLTADEQRQVDLSPCAFLQEQLDGIAPAAPDDESGGPGGSDFDEGADDSLCPHHPAHTDECGYVPESPETLCAFVCQVCPVEDLIGKLPDSISEDNSEQVQAQLSEISALYDELTADEQQQVDLSPCISLLGQLTGISPAVLSAESDPFYILTEDFGYSDPYEVSSLLEFDTNGHTFTGTGSAAIQVNGTGRLYLTGTVVSTKGAGAEVRPDGFLSITNPNTTITGDTYALDIAAGAEVHLSSGTYIGRNAAIRTADDNLAALLEPGYAFFDDSGTLLLPADAAWAQVVVVGPCPGHVGRTYSHDSGTTAHTWACPYCPAKETEPCTFTFGQGGNGACVSCENTIAIAVDENDLTGLVYDSTMKAEDVSVTVTLTDGSGRELVKDTDYKVDYTPRKDAGEITVTVTGLTFNGVFSRTYHVEQDQPGISWAAATCSVDYGIPVDSRLPNITITIQDPNKEDLHPYLHYFYRKAGDTGFTAGLPTNAGKYEVKAYIPESQNYKEAETNPYLSLTINQIPAVKLENTPKAKTLTYNREAQELVTAGVLEPGAAAEGAVIEFARAQGGPYSTDIPTEITAGNHNVWYRVTGTENYSGIQATKIDNVRIELKTLKPTVELEYYTTVYTGGDKEPVVTAVKDGDAVIPKSEYTVAYSSNQNVGTATVTVSNLSSGNYKITTATATFKITKQTQAGLSIANQPKTVVYGDQFTLGTQGGSGNGNVTWKITAGSQFAKVDEHSGEVTVTGIGSVTVQATKSGTDPSTNKTNYNDATASWTFNVKKKPVTATVTAEDKTYDGDTTVTLAVTVNGMVSGDSGAGVTASGHFKDANAGTGKTVIITGLTVPDTISAKYDISYSGPTTAAITPRAAEVPLAPEKIDSLKYTGRPQDLVTPGAAANGKMAYSLDGIKYSFIVPQGTEAKSYTVWYKAVADDENHKDSVPVQVDGAAIGANTDGPKVTCSPSWLPFNGSEKTPTVIVLDSEGREIPKTEYSVELPSPRIDPGTYTVIVKDKEGGNYAFSGEVPGTFEIVPAGQNPLSIITDKPTNIYYGDTFKLSAMGGSGSGAVQWRIEQTEAVASIDSNGVVTVDGVGGFTVKAYRKGADGYSDSNTEALPFHADPKPVTPTVTADEKPYDGAKTATLHATWKTGDLVGDDSVPLTVEGEFVSADAGDSKTVRITKKEAGGDSGKYLITWPDSTTATISKVNAEIRAGDAPKPKNLTYKKNAAQELVTRGSTVGGIGTIVYSTSQNGVYAEDIPTGTNAGKYTVWYKVADSVNYTGIPAAELEVEIAKADPEITSNSPITGTEGQPLSEISLEGVVSADVDGTFAWKNDSDTVENGKSYYDVIFTPDDKDNYNTVTGQVQVTIPEPPEPEPEPEPGNDTNSTSASRPGTSSAAANTLSTPAQTTTTTVRNGTASTVVSAADGSKLVQDAVANQSRNVVIKPEIAGNVTKTEVSIPSSTVSQLSRKTDAALTVSSPVADVTIPNTALGTLSQAGGNVNVVTEQVEQSVVLTLAAGGETVEQVPGGVTLTVPVEDAGPGTVAVLVHDDGTRETIRKSVVEDGVVSIPLSGSATVEIVDNSKDFADVPPESWAADAVDFASAHELFSGTSETTFSPDQPISRGMLATVLYRLEGSPDQDLADLFNGVGSGAWYEEGVTWAAESGIAGGYGDGQLGPDDSITREQFVVMLWRYAGSPEASSQVLDFVDADQVSSFALEALCWAAENGILHGVGDGVLDPGGTATRAQAAQLLKNFMENT